MEYRMPISELFSKRKRKRERAGQPAIYQYDEIPEEFRNQVRRIWKKAIGTDPGGIGGRATARVWEEIHDSVSPELGWLALGTEGNPMDSCFQVLLKGNTEQVLDIVEASFQCIEHHFGGYKGRPEDMEEDTGLSGSASPDVGVVRGMGITEEDMRRPLSPDMAIEELNQHFLENDLGYQYRNGRIIRIDSEYTHSEIVLPALQLLNEPEFKPALDEFLKGHEDYRRGRYEDAINEALKAFESTMKIICENRGWKVVSKKRKKLTVSDASASDLIQTCFEHGLIPVALQRHFTNLRRTLESGLPTVRNEFSAHGDGVETVEVPDYLAQYALNLAASNIVLLINAYRTSTGG
jgi:hypothetical protein